MLVLILDWLSISTFTLYFYVFGRFFKLNINNETQEITFS